MLHFDPNMSLVTPLGEASVGGKTVSSKKIKYDECLALAFLIVVVVTSIVMTILWANCYFGGSGCCMRIENSIQRGDLVILNDNEAFVKSEFSKSFFVWADKMKFMLGKSYNVLEICDCKTVALPSEDGSQNGLWYFPNTVVTKLNYGMG